MASHPVPDDLAAALAQSPESMRAFERLPPSHQREYVQWIDEAKKEATRRRRINQTLDRLRDGRISR